MNASISRRNFMKGTGAVALAVACSSLLAGCGGNAKTSTSCDIGAVRIDVAKEPKIQWEQEGSKASGYIIPTVSLSIISNNVGKLNKTYSALFSAKIGDTTLKLSNGSKSVDISDGWFSSEAETVKPSFVITKEQYDALNNGESLILTIEPYDKQYAIYTVPLTGAVSYTRA